MEYYNPNAMKPEDKIESLFIKWYNRNQSENFDFQTNILSNCRSNVDILRHACLRFRKMFIEITATEGTPEIDPFESCITIASACNLVIRTNFLESESIGIIPPHGYRPQQNQSRKAIQWIRCISQRENINIQHALNGGEKQIGSYFVDGYTVLQNGVRTVYEFQSCVWHGCHKCFSENTKNPVNGSLMSDL